MPSHDYSIDMLLINPYATTEREDSARVGTIGIPEGYILRCLNPGILSIATHLDSRGYRVNILDLSERDGTAPLVEYLQQEQPRVIGISCMTGFAYISALGIARVARQYAPHSLIAMGGQHIGPLREMVLQDAPEVDVVALYEGEVVSEQLVESTKGYGSLGQIKGIAWRDGSVVHCNRNLPLLLNLSDLPPLRYDLYPAYETFPPYVEESRGCFANCEFCVTPLMNGGRLRGKSPDRILCEVDHVRNLFGDRNPINLLASTFGIRLSPTLKLVDGLARRGITWTSEIRADSSLARHINRLADAGAVSLFVGVESASPTQLLRMQKTTRPEAYLSSLRQLLAAAQASPSLLLKLGFLFYIGEDGATMRETLTFLTQQAEYISWISVSPLIVFQGTPLANRFRDYERRYGASLYRDGFWGRSRTYPCNVSRNFSFKECVEAARFMETVFRRPAVTWDRVAQGAAKTTRLARRSKTSIPLLKPHDQRKKQRA